MTGPKQEHRHSVLAFGFAVQLGLGNIGLALAEKLCIFIIIHFWFIIESRAVLRTRSSSCSICCKRL